MNYQKIHDQIVKRAISENREKGLGIYYERHHIIPKCIGGSNDKENLVLLTAREHFLCHWLLARIYPSNQGLSLAFWTMCSWKENGNQQRFYTVSSRVYEEARNQIKTTCEFCNKIIDIANYNQYHGEKCKLHPDYKIKLVTCPWCNKEGNERGMLHSHFENCFKNPNIKQDQIDKRFKQCEWCLKTIDIGNYTLSHGNNCKLNPNYIKRTINSKRGIC